jgi:hypothetical protein
VIQNKDLNFSNPLENWIICQERVTAGGERSGNPEGNPGFEGCIGRASPQHS